MDYPIDDARFKTLQVTIDLAEVVCLMVEIAGARKRPPDMSAEDALAKLGLSEKELEILRRIAYRTVNYVVDCCQQAASEQINAHVGRSLH